MRVGRSTRLQSPSARNPKGLNEGRTTLTPPSVNFLASSSSLATPLSSTLPSPSLAGRNAHKSIQIKCPALEGRNGIWCRERNCVARVYEAARRDLLREMYEGRPIGSSKRPDQSASCGVGLVRQREGGEGRTAGEEIFMSRQADSIAVWSSGLACEMRAC